MGIKTYRYLLLMGLKNLWKNKVYSMSTVVTMSVCIFLFSLFYATALNVDSAVQKTEEQISVLIFFEPGVTDQRIEEIGELIRQRPEVKETVYISAEDAWADFQSSVFPEEANLKGILNEDNPLENSDNYEVYLNRIKDQPSFVEFAEGLEGVRSVKHSTDAVNALVKLENVITSVVMGMTGLLIIISAVLIRNTLVVGIEAQREKTRVMRLMGAREAFVRIPFILEGIVMGLIGVAVPLAVFWFSYRWGADFMSKEFHLFQDGIRLIPLGRLYPRMVRACVLLGAGVGVTGSLFAMHKLKDKKSRTAS